MMDFAGAYRSQYTIGYVLLQTTTANAEGFFTVEIMKPGDDTYADKPTFADAMAVGRDLVRYYTGNDGFLTENDGCLTQHDGLHTIRCERAGLSWCESG